MEAVSLIRTPDESITWLNKFFLATEIVECFRREQLNFGVVWDKLIWLKSHLTQEADPDEVGGVNAVTAFKILANVVPIKFKCGSSSLSTRKRFEKE